MADNPNRKEPPYPTTEPLYPTTEPVYPTTEPPYPTKETPYPTAAPYPTEPPPTYSDQEQFQQGHSSAYVVGGSVTQTTTTFTPAYGYASPTAPGVTVVTSQPLSSVSTRITCPHCMAEISTAVKYETSGMTHCLACVLCCFICWPLAWIPYVTDCTKNAQHQCPSCHRHIGTYKR